MIEAMPEPIQQTVDDFHRHYYNYNFYGVPVWGQTFWMGTPVLKCPLDLWIYQEIIYKVKPDLIIECGTARGGSALYMAHLCDIIDRGRIISIDTESRPRPQHNRVDYILGGSTDNDVVSYIKKFSRENSVMVVLDSDHKKDHVAKELKIYSQLVTKGSYLIVEDTNINGHPVGSNHGPGPWEAVQEFMTGNKDFAVDKSMEKFYLTFNPFGYLIRV